MLSLPDAIAVVLLPFQVLLAQQRSWQKAQVMLVGAWLCRSQRKVSRVLRVMGLAQACDYGSYYRLLSRVKWSGLSPSLPHQHTHVFTRSEWSRDDGGEFGAVAGKLSHIALVDQMVDLFATANNPNLRFFLSRNGQQFIEFCGHGHDDSLLMLVKEEELKVWTYPIPCSH
jgi:hypothetical protein